MSNFLAPIVRRHGGTFAVSVDSGPAVDATPYMGLLVNAAGEVLATSDIATPHHYHNAMPFDVDGRLMVEDDVPVRWDQGIPFTANDMVSAQLPTIPGHWDQGVLFTEDGHISAEGAAPPVPTAPIWRNIPAREWHVSELTKTIELSAWVISNAVSGTLVNYVLVTPITGYTLNSVSGQLVIDATAETATPSFHVTNDVGTSAVPGTVSITVDQSPIWATIPNQPEGTANLLLASYLTYGSGTRTYSLATTPAGYAIDSGTGEITHSGIYFGTQSLQGRVTDDTVTNLPSNTFTWAHADVRLYWGPDIPSIPDTQTTVDTTLYLNSGVGIRTYAIVQPATGFAIDAAGLLSITDAAPGPHTVQVEVSDDTVTDLPSNTFSWTVASTGFPEYLHDFKTATMGAFATVGHRAGVATGVDSVGLVRTVGQDVPVFTGGLWNGSGFDTDANCRGLQMENAATNYVRMSGTLDNGAAWLPSNTAAIPSAIPGPGGDLNAFDMVMSGGDFSRYRQTGLPFSNDAALRSVYARSTPAEGDGLVSLLILNTASNSPAQRFNVTSEWTKYDVSEVDGDVTLWLIDSRGAHGDIYEVMCWEPQHVRTDLDATSIISSGAADAVAMRAETTNYGAVVDMGIAEKDDDFSFQAVVELNSDMAMYSADATLLETTGSSLTVTIQAPNQLLLSVGGRVETVVATLATSPLKGDTLEVRYSKGASGERLWAYHNGVKVGYTLDAGLTTPLATPLSGFHVGAGTAAGSVVEGLVGKFRLVESELSVAEIEAWS